MVKRWLSKSGVALLWATLCVTWLLALPAPVFAEPAALPAGTAGRIASFVERAAERAQIPGLAVAVVTKEGVAYARGFGTAKAGEDLPVTEQTRFGVGPVSELFTALGVLRLKQQGALALDTPVDRYIPGFRAVSRGEEVPVTIGQLLHHTSGIPFQAADALSAPENVSLAAAVGRLGEVQLAFAPGTGYRYSPANYSLLGLVIEKVSGRAYEDYMNSLLREMGLQETGLDAGDGAASGHRLAFLRPRPDQVRLAAPMLPSLGFSSTAADLARWLSLHVAGPDEWRSLLEELQSPERNVDVQADGSSWTAGWKAYQNGGKLVSTGATPGFSAYVAFRPEESLGVVVLANLNTSQAEAIGEGVLALVQGREPAGVGADQTRQVDAVASVLLVGAGLLSIVLLGLIGLTLSQWWRGERRPAPAGIRSASSLLGALSFLAVLGLGVHYLPRVLFGGLSWQYVLTWQPLTLPVAVAAVCAAVALFLLYHLLLEAFPKEAERPYFLLATFSAMGGLGYTLIMFVIGQALSQQGAGAGLFLYFLIAIVCYIYAQRITRSKLIRMANQMVYEKRLELATKLLRTSYARFEQIEASRIYTSLGSDMELISNSVRDFVTLVTSVASILLFFIYLGVMSLYGLLLSVLFVAAGTGVMFLVNGYADKVWVQVAETQNAFFRFVGDLVAGFKELSLHLSRREAFEADLHRNLDRYRQQRIWVELLYTNGFIIGQLLIYIVIGLVVFAFPLLFPEIQQATLRNYVLVFLFMVGPVTSVVDLMPRATQMAVAWRRMNALVAEAEALMTDRPGLTPEPTGEFRLSLHGVSYRYRGEHGESFALGPIDCELRSGEIVFITGGNGSGKSTLAKLLTGLYEPDQGEIRIDGEPVEPRRLGEYFATVFSDFHLFDRMYGLEDRAVPEQVERYLRLLRIDHKVEVRDGAFSTTRLSTGQRKRLALMLAYLDDRPFYLFDEWAAEQDPEFRRFFYEELLPGMKARGRCVIAITHDDRYFGVADRVIKMELGQIVSGGAQPLSSGTAAAR